MVCRSEGSVLSLDSSLLSASNSERFKRRVLLNDRINSHFLPFTRVLIPNLAHMRCVSAVLRRLLCLSPYLHKGINRALPVVSLRARLVATLGNACEWSCGRFTLRDMRVRYVACLLFFPCYLSKVVSFGKKIRATSHYTSYIWNK